MDAAAYFKLLAALMKDNPPAKDDAPMVEKMAKLGIVPGKDFDPSKLDPAVVKALKRVPKAPYRWPGDHERPLRLHLDGGVTLLQRLAVRPVRGRVLADVSEEKVVFAATLPAE